MIYEWNEKECLLIKVDKMEIRDNGFVVISDKIWLMEQRMSVSEVVMNRVLEGV